MAFRFKLNEPTQKGFRRIGLEQIERAERELTTIADREASIHETRKSLKRVRALLRLVRPGLAEGIYRGENGRFRAIAGLLSSARDTHVLLATAVKLESLPGAVANAALAAAKKLIVEDLERSRSDEDNGVKEALSKLATAKKRFRRLTLDPDAFSTVERGLEMSYRSGRKAFARAYAAGTDEAFHEWRKTVQQHWRHMALVLRAWPEVFTARVTVARALSQILGDDHDLAVLVTYVRALPAERLSVMHAGEIERQARARQEELRKAAEPRGRILFAEGARGLARRVGLLWSAAEEIDRNEPQQHGIVPVAANEVHEAGKARS